MKYHLITKKTGVTVQYTKSLLEKLIKINGHTLVEPEEADIILVSLCDITEIGLLKATREKYNKTIVVGGAISFLYKTLALYADMVNVGQGFEFFECKTLEEIRSKPFIYTGKETTITPSVKINWNFCPIVQESNQKFAYWGATGCKNKCSFCFTSWTNKEDHNSKTRIERARKMTAGKQLYVISNEAEDTGNLKVFSQDMMLKTYLYSKTTPSCRFIKIGLEFATEKTRKSAGKFFTDKELIETIERARVENKMLQFFCIAGLDTKDDWFDMFAKIPDQHETNPKIVFKFTNLDYQMHTPLYKKRRQLDLSKYLDNAFNEELIKREGWRLGRMRTIPTKCPANALWRTGISSSVTQEQFDVFWDLRNCKDLPTLHEAYLNSGVIENDYASEINFWYKQVKQ